MIMSAWRREIFLVPMQSSDKEQLDLNLNQLPTKFIL